MPDRRRLPRHARPQVTGGDAEMPRLGDATIYALWPDERAVVREALDRATQGGFADEAGVDAVLRRPWN